MCQWMNKRRAIPLRNLTKGGQVQVGKEKSVLNILFPVSTKVTRKNVKGTWSISEWSLLEVPHLSTGEITCKGSSKSTQSKCSVLDSGLKGSIKSITQKQSERATPCQLVHRCFIWMLIDFNIVCKIL